MNIGWEIENIKGLAVVNSEYAPRYNHPVRHTLSPFSCPYCERIGMSSQSYYCGEVSTLMYSPPFTDEHGIVHDHDCNTLTAFSICTYGHEFVLCGTRPCPAEHCDYGKPKWRTAEVRDEDGNSLIVRPVDYYLKFNNNAKIEDYVAFDKMTQQFYNPRKRRT